MPTEINCPQCSSKNLIFSKKRNAYVCEDCDQVLPEKPVAPLRIFLSYGHDANEELVRRIKDDLEKRGHDVWFDKSEIKFGDDWRHSITDGILKSNRVLSFLSKHSTRDPGVCIDEIGIAIGVKGGNVQTILVEGEAEVQPPPSISHIQWLDMHEWKDKQGVGETTWNTWYNEKFAEIVRVVESDESVRFAGEIEDLMAKIKPVKSDTKMGELLRKPFIGRKWMHEAVESWRNKRDDDSRLFWIVGNPGVGKSAFVANLAHFGKARVIALHFCEWNKQSHKDPRQVVLNIAFQLACRLADYRKLLLALPQIDSLDAKSETELFDSLLVEPLRSVIDGGRERYLVIIDALDEANADGRNAVAEMLAQHTRRLPEWLGFLITSRPEEEVMTPLRGLSGLKPLILDTARQENLDDIRSYLRHELPNAKESEIDAILNKSDGVFLYAEYVCEELRHNRLFLDRLDAFPHGLGGIYAQYFARQFPDLATYKKATRHVLGVLAAAREPLESWFLAALFGWDTYQQEDFFDSMGSLLRLSANTVHPFHKSLFDWLSDKSKSGSYFISNGEGQKQLADHGMREYRRSVQELSAYNLRHLPSHLTELERWEDLIGDDKTPGPLTDLLFIQAKCEAGLVHELVSDYNVALAALPEFREENERNKRHDAAMMAYNKALREYAVARCDWWFAKERGETHPEPPYPALPAELRDDAQRVIPEDSWPRAARLRHFANFIFGNLDPLSQSAQNTLPLAYNWSDSGPVAEQAEVYIHGHTFPWLKRRSRPSAPPLRPQCIRILEYQGKGDQAINANVSMSPDGKRAGFWVTDTIRQVWDLETGRCLATLDRLNVGVKLYRENVSLDLRRAVSINSDNKPQVWDLENGACLATLDGHTDKVLSVSICPNGRFAISASEDMTLRVWNLETGVCQGTLEGHTDKVYKVSVSPDGRRAVSVSKSNTLRVWDLETGRCLAAFSGTISAESWMNVSPDGCRAVSWRWEEPLRIWDLENGACLATLECSRAFAYLASQVSISPDSRRIVLINRDNKLQIFDLENGACLAMLEGHTDKIRDVSFSPDGQRAVSGSYDKTLRVWDLETGKCLAILEGHAAAVLSVSVSPDGRRAVSASSDKTLRVWDLETNRCLCTLKGHVATVANVSVCSKGRRAISVSWDNTIRIWDLENVACGGMLEGHSSGAWSVWSVSLTPDGHRAVSGSEDKTLRVWSLETGRCLATLEGHKNGLNLVSLTPDGRRAVSASSDKTLRVWDLESNRCLCTLEGHVSRVTSVRVCPNGRRAVSASEDKTLRVWDLESGACLAMLEGHTDKIRDVSFSPDGQRAVSGSYDKTLRVWDLETGKCLAILEGHAAAVFSVSVSPDGRRAVSASSDKTLRVWDLETNRCLSILEGHEAPMVSLSPDGRRAVSASCFDKTLRVWDLKSGVCLATLKGHTNTVISLSVSPDGRCAVSGSYDHTIRIWDLGTGNCLAVYHGGSSSATAFASDGTCIICGTWDGQMHFLTPVNFPPSGPPIVTPVRLWFFGDSGTPGRWDDHITCGCAHCGKRFDAPPVKAGDEPHSEKCPHCNGTLMINPFVVDHKL